ncbi:MAG: hypothetical protein H0U66_12510 [Gemmatimonadaceae bacterium]|nr:hypothetical protein [Gemmatimonadaceae bacterium]
MSATIDQLETQIARDLATDTKNRATEAARHLRLAIDLVHDLQGSAAMSRAAHHMNEAATALLEVL